MSILRRIANLFHRSKLDQEIEAELRAHIEMRTADNIAAGMSLEEARRQAVLRFGSRAAMKERVIAADLQMFLDSLWQDLCYELRMLRKSPGFATVAVLTLALGIGANTAVFSMLNRVLLRPLPYRDPAHLVWVTQFAPRMDSTTVPAATFLAWRNWSHSFQDVAAYVDHLCDGNFSSSGEPVRLDRCAEVTPNFFSVLGIQPALGRGFLPSEGLPGGPETMILSDTFWHRRFGADRAVLGRTVELDGVDYTVVGVLPASYEHPGVLIPDAFVALRLPSKPDWRERESDDMSVIARLKSGATIEAARAELNAITQSLEKEYPPSIAEKLSDSQIQVMPLHEHIVGDTRSALLVLMAAVGLVLLIACVNVANLLLARGVARHKEFAVRATLGAARLRIARQLLTEGILLAILGSAAGLLVAWGTMRLVRSLEPVTFARFGSVHINGTALAVALVISLGTGLLFSLAPAFLVSRQDLTNPLREATDRATAGTARQKYGNVLVAFEMALAFLLLIGAGLLIRSFANLRAVNPGFDPRNVLTVQVTLTEKNYPQASQQKVFFDRLLAAVQTLPGVQSVGGTTSLPLYYGLSRPEPLEIENRPSTLTGSAPSVPISQVTPGYLEAMRIPLEGGRFFTPEDREGTLPVAIVSREFARRFLTGENPIGLHLRFRPSRNGSERDFTIVGMVGDVRYFGPSGQLAPVVFTSTTQFPTSALTLAVRTSNQPKNLTALIRREVQNLDKDQPIYHVATMEQRLANSVGPQRFDALLLGIFAAVAAVLAGIGVFGIMSYWVTQRTHEIGIRIALGGQTRQVLRLVMGHVLRLTIGGLAVGLVGAFALARLLAALLFGVRPTDTLTYLVVLVATAGIAFAASALPTLRALRVDPMVALRHE
jgi:putative ABC transport system permease protein